MPGHSRHNNRFVRNSRLEMYCFSYVLACTIHEGWPLKTCQTDDYCLCSQHWGCADEVRTTLQLAVKYCQAVFWSCRWILQDSNPCIYCRWSDDKLKSNYHRVRMPLPGEDKGSRYSIAYFNQVQLLYLPEYINLLRKCHSSMQLHVQKM